MKNFFGSDPSMRLELEQRLAAGINLPDAERLGVALAAVRSCVTGTSGPDPLAQRLVTAFVRPAVPMGVALGTSNRDIGIAASLWPDASCFVRQPLSRASGSTVIPLYGGLAPAGLSRTSGQSPHARSPGKFVTRVSRHAWSRVVNRSLWSTFDPPRFADQSLLAFLVLDGAPQFTNGWHTSEPSGGKSGAVATIGYTARDSRTGDPLLDLVYEPSFNQKCVAPGKLLNSSDDGFLTHDCASVGNTAGAPDCRSRSGARSGPSRQRCARWARCRGCVVHD